MKKIGFREKLKAPAYSELFIIGVITLILIILGLTIDWTESVVIYLYKNLDTPLDDIVIPLTITGLLLGIYIIRRNNEKRVLIDEFEKTKTELFKKSEEVDLLMRSSSAILYRTKLDENFTVLYTSENIKQVLGYTVDEMYYPNFFQNHLHPDDVSVVFGNISTLFEKGFYETEYRFKHKDGTWRWMRAEMKTIPDENGKPVEMVGNWWDISRHKEIEKTLQEAFSKSEESARAKSEFLANMSHEIRTPLNGIVGMTDLALETELTTDQRRYLETVKISCDNLMALINDILDFSKIEAGKLELSPVNFSLRDEVAAFLSSLGLKASMKKLELVFSLENDVPDSLYGDMHRLQQIISNLIGNAIKFTERGEIILQASVKEVLSDEVLLQFSVSDTGIGISKNKLESIFEEFNQADGSTTRKYGGTGLGLSITRRLVEMMGGKLWVESLENKGSTFHFTLRMKLQKEQKNLRFIPQPVLDNTPVLIIEDNHSTSEYIVKVLKNFTMKPVAVETGEQGLIELKKALEIGNPFPIVLLDINLSGKMDGFDVADKIKNDPDLLDTDIIVVTMSQKVSDREKFAQLGVNQYFSKPFSQSDLLDCIQNLLSGRSRSTNVTIPKSNHIQQDASTPQTKHYKILLAEDNEVNQEVAASMLAKKGHIVIIANNGDEAVSIFAKESFDFIFMDVQMPVLNGYEATARIREIEKSSGKHVPIIGLTANAMKGDREKCLEAGMDDYVSKPIRMSDLFEAIERSK